MRILAVTPYYAPEGGGLERYAHEILRRLARRGHDVAALAFTTDEPGRSDHDGVVVQRVRPTLRIGNAPVHAGFTGQVRRLIRSFDPDVLVAHTPVPYPAEMAYLAARSTDTPFVTTYHAGRLRATASLLRGLALIDRWTLERMMLKRSVRLIAVSPHVRDAVLNAHRDRVTVVPPGVDADRFHPLDGGDGRTILFVAPLSRRYRWKGIDVLWRAYTEVQARHPEARLMLVGTGDRVDAFRKKADRERKRVVFAGRLDEAALIQAYQQAALLVLPSTEDVESFGMVMAEANACGRPVVGTRVGGIPSFLRDGENGLLVSPGDAKGLAEAMSRLLDDPELGDRLGGRGRERVQREHDWDRLTDRTETVLHQAAGLETPERIVRTH